MHRCYPPPPGRSSLGLLTANITRFRWPLAGSEFPIAFALPITRYHDPVVSAWRDALPLSPTCWIHKVTLGPTVTMLPSPSPAHLDTTHGVTLEPPSSRATVLLANDGVSMSHVQCNTKSITHT